MPPDDLARFLAAYRRRDHPSPSVTVDLVVFTVLDAELQVLLIRRGEQPFVGAWALPGGFVRVGDSFEDQGEDIESAASRELEEETGLPAGEVFLEQIGAFGAAGRDPRKRIISIAYAALIRPDLAPSVVARGDARSVDWVPLSTLQDLDRALDLPRDPLAFDHAHILWVALRWVRTRIQHDPLAFDLLAPTFTLSELQAVYEAIDGTTSDPSNFRRRFRRMIEDGTIEQLDAQRREGPGRPARLHRFVRRDHRTSLT